MSELALVAWDQKTC